MRAKLLLAGLAIVFLGTIAAIYGLTRDSPSLSLGAPDEDASSPAPVPAPRPGASAAYPSNPPPSSAAPEAPEVGSPKAAVHKPGRVERKLLRRQVAAALRGVHPLLARCGKREQGERADAGRQGAQARFGGGAQPVLLEVETLEGAIKILDAVVPRYVSGGGPIAACVQNVLRGQVFPAGEVKAGGRLRLSMALPRGDAAPATATRDRHRRIDAAAYRAAFLEAFRVDAPGIAPDIDLTETSAQDEEVSADVSHAPLHAD